MSNYIDMFFKTLILFITLYSFTSISAEKSVLYNCTGLSQFELIGSSGTKEEVKVKKYKFVDGMLHDLNIIFL